MDLFLQLLGQYGLPIVFVAVLLEQGGLPLPAYPVVVAASSLAVAAGEPAWPIVAGDRGRGADRGFRLVRRRAPVRRAHAPPDVQPLAVARFLRRQRARDLPALGPALARDRQVRAGPGRGGNHHGRADADRAAALPALRRRRGAALGSGRSDARRHVPRSSSTTCCCISMPGVAMACCWSPSSPPVRRLQGLAAPTVPAAAPDGAHHRRAVEGPAGQRPRRRPSSMRARAAERADGWIPGAVLPAPWQRISAAADRGRGLLRLPGRGVRRRLARSSARGRLRVRAAAGWGLPRPGRTRACRCSMPRRSSRGRRGRCPNRARGTQCRKTMRMPVENRKSVVLAPGHGRSYPMGRLSAVFKADGAETAGAYSISEWWLEPHTQGPGAHSHPEDDVFYVIAGYDELHLEDARWIDAPRGSFVLVPGGIDARLREPQRPAGRRAQLLGAWKLRAAHACHRRWFHAHPPGQAGE